MAAIILAGGKSLRMGCDKSLIMIDGEAMIERIIRTLSGRFEDIIVCGRNYEIPGVKYVDDCCAGAGPMGGLYSGLSDSHDDVNFVTACDIPEIDINIIDYMEYCMEGHDAAVIKAGEYAEPLFAFYSASILPVIEGFIANRNYALRSLYDSIDVKFVPMEELKKMFPSFQGILNINNPSDLKEYLSKFKRAGK